MKKKLLLVFLLLPGLFAAGQKKKLAKTSAGFPVNYEEDSVGTYTLPDVLMLSNGEKVRDAKTWTDRQIDAKRIALQGTSRLGKTVLWTGAYDTRYKMVIASCSGEGGAAISRRNYGENIKHITDTSRYYYQFAPNYHSYADRVERLPFDAHMLVALMAPRPLLLQTGDTDYWSDPKGEFLAAVAATPVYELFNERGPGSAVNGSPAAVMPEGGEPSLMKNKLGYYMHKGGHGTLPGDWPLFIEFMKKYL